MGAYLAKTSDLMSCFERFKIVLIPREENHKADTIAQLASNPCGLLPKMVSLEVIVIPSINEMQEVHYADLGPCWINPIHQFLATRILPQMLEK
ncbi:hypothetical protein ACOSQ3_009993 [Xanthoceras sorbifolium]